MRLRQRPERIEYRIVWKEGGAGSWNPIDLIFDHHDDALRGTTAQATGGRLQAVAESEYPSIAMTPSAIRVEFRRR